MKNNSNPLNTVLLVILALIVADIFLNDGRALASLTSGNDTAGVPDTAVQAVDGQNLNNIILPPAPSGTPAGVTFAVVDEGSEPVIRNLVPIPPATAEPEQPPEAIINWSEELARPTATHRALTDEQLLACVSAQQDGRRLAPYCPADASELLGEGR
jgi:hypothetical protein